MGKHLICLIEGDGIGHEVIQAAKYVLEGIQVMGELEFEWLHAQAGWELFERTGDSIPEATLETAKSAEATLFGAATSPSKKVAGFRGAIRHMRRALDLYANVRPAKHHAVPGSRAGVDLIIVRHMQQFARPTRGKFCCIRADALRSPSGDNSFGNG